MATSDPAVRRRRLLQAVKCNRFDDRFIADQGLQAELSRLFQQQPGEGGGGGVEDDAGLRDGPAATSPPLAHDEASGVDGEVEAEDLPEEPVPRLRAELEPGGGRNDSEIGGQPAGASSTASLEAVHELNLKVNIHVLRLDGELLGKTTMEGDIAVRFLHSKVMVWLDSGGLEDVCLLSEGCVMRPDARIKEYLEYGSSGPLVVSALVGENIDVLVSVKQPIGRSNVLVSVPADASVEQLLDALRDDYDLFGELCIIKDGLPLHLPASDDLLLSLGAKPQLELLTRR